MPATCSRTHLVVGDRVRPAGDEERLKELLEANVEAVEGMERLIPIEHQLHVVKIIDGIHPRTCQPLLA